MTYYSCVCDECCNILNSKRNACLTHSELLYKSDVQSCNIHKNCIYHNDVASGSEITPCNKIDIEDIYFFEVNTKYISSSAVKKSVFFTSA